MTESRPGAARMVRPPASIALLLSAVAVPLAAAAALAGLLWPEDLYGDPAVAAIIRGQDLITLLSIPVLAVALVAARRGSAHALIVVAGIMAYLLYTYTGAALAYDFNRLFLVYVAIFALSASVLVTLVATLDAEALRRRFDGAEPRRSVIAFLVFIAIALGIGELAQVVSAIASGDPPVIEGTDAPLNFVFALDLGVIVPLSVLAATWLWRGHPWGHLLAGVLLVKAATMGLALLSMSWFAARAGVPGDDLTPLWLIVAVGGLGLSGWFLYHCRD